MSNAYFWQGPNARLYRIDRTPESFEQLIVFIPPLLEDANCIRHVYTKMALIAEKQSIASVIFDYSGTGDSELDLTDISVAHWQAEITALFRDVKQAHPAIKVTFLACYSAAILLSEEINKLPDKLVFWHPEIKGTRYIKQLKRLALMQVSNSLESAPQYHDESVELLAGYQINKVMFKELSGCQLGCPDCASILWIEFSTNGVIPTLREKAFSIWQRRPNFTLQTANAAKFWQASELLLPDNLLQQTLLWMTQTDD